MGGDFSRWVLAPPRNYEPLGKLTAPQSPQQLGSLATLTHLKMTGQLKNPYFKPCSRAGAYSRGALIYLLQLYK